MPAHQDLVERHFNELQRDGVTVVRSGLSHQQMADTKAAFTEFAHFNRGIFGKYLDEAGHYPRIINLHLAFRPLLDLFAGNAVALAVQDRFFGRPSSVCTSLYYERGPAQPIQRDSPYLCTRPERLYLGVSVAPEPAGLANGCLGVVRGGHLIPEIDREQLALEFGHRDPTPTAMFLQPPAAAPRRMTAAA